MHRSILPVLLIISAAAPAGAQVFGEPQFFSAAGPQASWPSLAESGLALYFTHDSGGPVSVIRRTSLAEPWGSPDTVYDSQPAALGARVSQDGLELFAYAFVGQLRQIHLSRRSSLTDRFPPLRPVNELAAPNHRGPGYISEDGKTLYFWDSNTTLRGWYATRSNAGLPFVDRGSIHEKEVCWISRDERVALTWGGWILRRERPSSPFDTVRSAGSMTQPLTGACTFYPESGELLYWRDDGRGRHQLMIAMRKDTLVDYSDTRIGRTIDVDVYGRPVELWVLIMGTATQSFPLPPFGTIRVGGSLSLASFGIIPSSGLTWAPTLDPYPGTAQVPIPSDTQLANVVLHWQALSVDRVALQRGSLTNLVSTTIRLP